MCSGRHMHLLVVGGHMRASTMASERHGRSCRKSLLQAGCAQGPHQMALVLGVLMWMIPGTCCCCWRLSLLCGTHCVPQLLVAKGLSSPMPSRSSEKFGACSHDTQLVSSHKAVLKHLARDQDCHAKSLRSSTTGCCINEYQIIHI